MAIPTWPSSLPQSVLRENYRQTQPDGRLFSKTDSGPPKTRRRFSAAVRKVECKILVDVYQVAAFDRFWFETLGGGAVPFILRDQIFDGSPLLADDLSSITDDMSSPLVTARTWLVKFDEAAPSTTPWGALFEISFSLLVLP